jgi:hypothetical protein
MFTSVGPRHLGPSGRRVARRYGVPVRAVRHCDHGVRRTVPTTRFR